MSTRSITFVYTDSMFGQPEEPILKLCTHGDGYPSAYGLELANFINSKEIVNGLNSGLDMDKIANGMDCLGAQLIAHLKKKPGKYYLLPLYPKKDDNGSYDYVYHVHKSFVEVIGNPSFVGSWEHFGKFCADN